MKTLRFLLVITVAIAFTLLLTPAVKAAEEAAEPAVAEKAEPAKAAEKAEPAKKAEKEKMPTVKGEIVSVDAETNAVVIKDAKGKETKVEVDKDTAITKGKDKLAIGDLKAGEKVTAKGPEADGKMIAKSIKVHIPKVAKAKPKAEEKKTEPEKAAEPETK